MQLKTLNRLRKIVLIKTKVTKSVWSNSKALPEVRLFVSSRTHLNRLENPVGIRCYEAFRHLRGRP